MRYIGSAALVILIALLVGPYTATLESLAEATPPTRSSSIPDVWRLRYHDNVSGPTYGGNFGGNAELQGYVSPTANSVTGSGVLIASPASSRNRSVAGSASGIYEWRVINQSGNCSAQWTLACTSEGSGSMSAEASLVSNALAQDERKMTITGDADIAQNPSDSVTAEDGTSDSEPWVLNNYSTKTASTTYAFCEASSEIVLAKVNVTSLSGWAAGGATTAKATGAIDAPLVFTGRIDSDGDGIYDTAVVFNNPGDPNWDPESEPGVTSEPGINPGGYWDEEEVLPFARDPNVPPGDDPTTGP